MAKLSLLDMTQSILSAMDSDPVDDIAETVEAVQVADLVREAFFEIMARRDWPFLQTLSQLQGLGDTSNPTKMMMPDNLNKVFWIKYNKRETKYMAPEDFQDMLDSRSVQTGVVNSNGFVINRDPEYWTSFDDKYVFFDSIDLAQTNTLIAANSVVYGVQVPSWTHTNTFIPDIPEKFFPTLLSEAKAQAFVNLKQQSNQREEAKARRGLMTMRNESWRNDNGEYKYNRKVNYGR